MSQFKYQTNEYNGEKWVSNLNTIETSVEDIKKNESWPPKAFIEKLDLNTFPAILDFSAEIKNYGSDTYINFKSKEHGIMGTIPVYYNHFPQLPFYGTLEQPYSDMDYCWHVILFRKDNFVYVMFGYDEDSSEYELYYKVPVEVYEAELKKIF